MMILFSSRCTRLSKLHSTFRPWSSSSSHNTRVSKMRANVDSWRQVHRHKSSVSQQWAIHDVSRAQRTDGRGIAGDHWESRFAGTFYVVLDWLFTCLWTPDFPDPRAILVSKYNAITGQLRSKMWCLWVQHSAVQCKVPMGRVPNYQDN